MRTFISKSLATVATLAAMGLAPMTSTASDTEPVKVVASFSILADMVKQVGGDYVSVTSLVGPNEDPHVFDPSPADAKALADADMVVINGMHFEGWIDRLIKSSGFDGKLVVASDGVVPIDISGDEHHQHGEHEHHDDDKHDHGDDGHKHDDHKHNHAGHDHHDHGDVDPHAWQSLSNASVYVQNIQDALVDIRPAVAGDVVALTGIYLQQIDELNQKIIDQFNEIPKDARRVVASHDAFAYFGQAYDIKFFTLQGLTTEQEPSAADIANLVREIKKDKIKALFVENISDPRLLNRVAEEAGVAVGGKLYSGALSAPGTAADTYLKMMAYNADAIFKALRNSK